MITMCIRMDCPSGINASAIVKAVQKRRPIRYIVIIAQRYRAKNARGFYRLIRLKE